MVQYFEKQTTLIRHYLNLKICQSTANRCVSVHYTEFVSDCQTLDTNELLLVLFHTCSRDFLCAKFQKTPIVCKFYGDLLAAVCGMCDVYARKMFETSYLKKLINDLMWRINRRL